MPSDSGYPLLLSDGQHDGRANGRRLGEPDVPAIHHVRHAFRCRITESAPLLHVDTLRAPLSLHEKAQLDVAPVGVFVPVPGALPESWIVTRWVSAAL